MFETGRIALLYNGETDDLVGFAESDDAISELLESFDGKQVWCSYVFSPEPITPEVVITAALDAADGWVDADYGARYSDITGYLWTDNKGWIGGHNLVAVFEQHVGEYGCLIVEEHPIMLEDYL